MLKYDAACQAIAEANSIDEVTDWVDKAAAVREYGRRIKNRQIEIDAIEIRVKAKRRRGEILADLKASGRLVSPRTARTIESPDNDLITLEDLGVSRNESSEDQRLAAIPGDSFARLVARCRAHAEAHPEKHSFDVLGENAGLDKKQARENRERILGTCQQALPDKKFGVILADPEWRFKTYSRETGMDRAADNHYPTSETDAICARPVGDIAAADCVLFLWATVPMLPDALRVMTAWGFEYKSYLIWKKDRIGNGYWFRNQHELLLVGTRGNIPAPAMGTQFTSVIDAPLGKHSEKPDAFYEVIEHYFPTLPKIELNARRARDGWEAWGNEAPKDELPPHDLETGEVIEAIPTAVGEAIEAGPTAGLDDDARRAAFVAYRNAQNEARLWQHPAILDRHVISMTRDYPGAISFDVATCQCGWSFRGETAPFDLARDEACDAHWREVIENSVSPLGLPSGGETVTAAAEATSERASPAAAVTEPAFPPTELSDLRSFECGDDERIPAAQVEALAPAYVRRGLVHAWCGSWRLSPAGVIRLQVLTRERAARDALFAKRLAADELAEWRALAAIAGREPVDSETARDLIGKGYVDDFAADRGLLGLTDSGAKWLGSIEAYVEKTEGIDRALTVAPAPAPMQLDLTQLLEGAK